ncbi:related to tRNA (guanosine(18)-2'-O)-methyltransferase [Saccharomycodes ludwigii]|uniref:Related to tRNA (Guanosine(18)-2'-O)-methyltransferase n=1 Tax=Saccharomycodes ludwigii TaxID=36035 RepID=A0A376B9L9_9ASCO|nr:related to tRNA (guanosine(18)-2'-O)-methyltransferase [Saccharomycodes ludwigii]
MPTKSSALITKYLSKQAQSQLIHELLDSKDFKSLYDILSTLDVDNDLLKENTNHIFAILKETLTSCMSESNENVYDYDAKLNTPINNSINDLINLVTVFPSLINNLMNWACDILVEFITRNSSTLFKKDIYYNFIKPHIPPAPVCSFESLDINVLFHMLERLFLLDESLCVKNKLLDTLLFFLQLSEWEEISQSCSKLMRWRIKTIIGNIDSSVASSETKLDVWKIIEAIYSEHICTETGPPKWIFKAVFLFWLRYLINCSRISCNFIDFLKSDSYWNFIQLGLISSVHEFKKIALSVLKMTFQKLNECDVPLQFSNEYISYPIDDKLQITAWKKFITLYEIIAIDTALNQFEDASSDVLELFGNKNIIHPNWGLLILSSGMKSSMESVRKYTLKLMFAINDKSIFTHNLKDLQTIYIPNMLQASNFVVVSENLTNSILNEDLACPYSDILVNFIVELIQASPSPILSTLFEVLQKQTSGFDPAKIYLTYGIYSALLKSKKSISLEIQHLLFLPNLFRSNCEEKVFKTTWQVLLLKLLLHCPSVNLNNWIEIIAGSIKVHGYEYFQLVAEDFRDYAVVNYGKGDIKETDDIIHQVLTFILFDVTPKFISEAFLLELCKISINTRQFETQYNQLLMSKIRNHEQNYTNASLIFAMNNSGSTATVFTDITWNSIDLKKSIDKKTLFDKVFQYDKFEFFVELYGKISKYSYNQQINDFISFEDINNYYLVIKDCTVSNTLNSKHKDKYYSKLFELLGYYLTVNALTANELTDLIDLLKRNLRDSSGYLSNLKIVAIINYIFSSSYVSNSSKDDQTVQELFNICVEIWDFVSNGRLVLNQSALHLALIDTIYHSTVLSRAFNNVQISKSLLNIGNNFVLSAIPRRSFLPLLSFKLNEFVCNFTEYITVENGSWLLDLALNIFSTDHVEFNIFKIKPVIAKLFDKHLKVYIPGGLYEMVYGPEEVSYKVNIISLVVRLPSVYQNYMMCHVFENDINITKPKKRTDGPENLIRLEKWQLMLLLLPNVELNVLSDVVADKLIGILKNDEPSPLCRICCEWICAYEISRNKGKTRNLKTIQNLLVDHSKPVLVVSATRVCYMAIKSIKSENITNFDFNLLNEFLSYLITNSTSNKPAIRHFSSSLMLSVWPDFQDVITLGDKTLSNTVENLYLNAKKTQIHGQYRTGDANIWDIVKDLNLTSIFGGTLLKVTDHDVPYIRGKTFKKYLTSNYNEAKFMPIGKDEYGLWLGKRDSIKKSLRESKKEIILTSEQNKASPLQTKSGAWETVLNIDNNTDDMRNSDASNKIERSDLIVVASLVDKPPNLGGICRLCDVLGVGLLTVNDIRVKTHPQFKNVAVTADHWMPMEEVRIDNIVQFMKSKKAEGYTLIGLEQTDESIKLDNNYKFPPKSLILLGTEAEGIPGVLLGELDLCLEIKQFGVIRSMNIQTATAVIVYAYTIQNM